jgi:hypothetical protein
MPAAEEAQAYGTRIEEVVTQGLKTLRSFEENGKTPPYLAYVEENMENCKAV